jgi:hypothetical protein
MIAKISPNPISFLFLQVNSLDTVPKFIYAAMCSQPLPTFSSIEKECCFVQATFLVCHDNGYY